MIPPPSVFSNRERRSPQINVCLGVRDGNDDELCIGRGCASGSRHREWAVDTSDDQPRECAILLGAEDVTEGGAVDDSADVLARCAIMTPAGPPWCVDV